MDSDRPLNTLVATKVVARGTLRSTSQRKGTAEYKEEQNELRNPWTNAAGMETDSLDCFPGTADFTSSEK